MKYVKGDMVKLFSRPTDMLVHICNCVAKRPRPYSLGFSIIKRYKYSDPYSQRRAVKKNLAHVNSRPKPGTVGFCFPPGHHYPGGPVVANCFAQYRMGKCDSKYYENCHDIDTEYIDLSNNHDTYQDRLKYFRMCMYDEIIPFIKGTNSHNKIKRIIFPKNIGCGMAGGIWSDYKKIIEDFEKKIFDDEIDKSKYEIIIVEYTPFNGPFSLPKDK